MAREKPGQTLQPTALVHEAYLRLVDVNEAQQWNSRRHFFSAAAEAMRRILVERARQKNRHKTARIVGRPTGAKTNPRIRTILNGRDSAWIGLPFAPLIDIRVIIPSHRWLGGRLSPWLALDRKE